MMKKIITVAFTTAVMLGAAQAGEWADRCVAALEADGRDTSGCQCLEDAITGNDALTEEFLVLGEIADPAERYETASDDAKSAMDACTRS